jgi:uncharacterized membrane protein YfcA
LLLYVVGMKDPHVAIGTSALAVAANAFANLIQHARAGTVKWPCALVFGASGVIGALIGSTLGKMVAGQHLLVLFAGVMIVVGFPCCAANPAAATRACGSRAPSLCDSWRSAFSPASCQGSSASAAAS